MQKFMGLRPLLLFAVGAWFLIRPGSVYVGAKWLIVISLLAMAVPALLEGFQERNQGGSYNLVRGWLLILAALLVWLFLRPMMSLLPVVFGLLLVLYGINRVVTAKSEQVYVNVSPVSQMVYGVLVVAVGVILLFNPFGAVLLTLRLFGATMLVMGAMELMALVRNR